MPGRAVYSENTIHAGNQKTISLYKAPGVYWLDLESNGNRSVHRIIIE